MKLYTEKEIEETLESMGYEEMINDFFQMSEPIELPTDEDIAENEYNLSMEEMCRFKDGIEYLLKFINKQN